MDSPSRRGRAEAVVDVLVKLRRLTPLRLVRQFATEAFRELQSLGGKANFIGFIIAFLVLIPLLVYTLLNQLLPSISVTIEAAQLSIVPPDPTMGELVLLLVSLLVMPFAFGLCVRMFEAVDGWN